MSTQKRNVTDAELMLAFSKYRYGDGADECEWRRKTVACQLLKLDAGYAISHTQLSILRRLKLVTSKDKPNKKGRDYMFDVYFDAKLG